MEKKIETGTTNSVDEETMIKKHTNYLSMDFIKNNDNLDHVLEQGVVNVGPLKNDRKYDFKTDEEKHIF